MYAVTITAEGDYEIVPFESGLRYLQAAVGGLIEAVDFEVMDLDHTLWLNEEGKIHGLPYNDLATYLVAGNLFPGDYIVGDCIVTGGTGPEGETLGLEYDDAVIVTMVLSLVS